MLNDRQNSFLSKAKQYRDLAKTKQGWDRQIATDEAFIAIAWLYDSTIQPNGWRDKEKFANFWGVFLESAGMNPVEYPVGHSAIQQYGGKQYIAHGPYDQPVLPSVPLRPTPQMKKEYLAVLAS